MKRLHLILPLILLLPMPADSVVWTVAPDSSADFVWIQDAIDAANDGDEIRVRPGTYLELLHTRGKILDLIGEEGAAETIVDADGLGSGLTIPFSPGGIPTVTGLTFTNGIGTYLRANLRDGRFGGGAWVELAAPRFEHCRFVGNRADYGGGVYVIAGSPLFVECDFSSNAAGSGGGFAAENDGGIRLVDCRIRENQAVFGGGVDLFRSRIEIESTLIADNSALEGGAVCARDADLEIESVTVADNESGPGGVAIDLRDSATTLVSTILAVGSDREAISCDGGSTGLDCVVLFTPGGDDEHCGEGDGVAFSDPRFCDPESGDYTLGSDSPCLPGQGPPGCGQIGALGLGCDGPVAVESLRLGTLKRLFR